MTISRYDLMTYYLNKVDHAAKNHSRDTWTGWVDDALVKRNVNMFCDSWEETLWKLLDWGAKVPDHLTVATNPEWVALWKRNEDLIQMIEDAVRNLTAWRYGSDEEVETPHTTYTGFSLHSVDHKESEEHKKFHNPPFSQYRQCETRVRYDYSNRARNEYGGVIPDPTSEDTREGGRYVIEGWKQISRKHRMVARVNIQALGFDNMLDALKVLEPERYKKLRESNERFAAQSLMDSKHCEKAVLSLDVFAEFRRLGGAT